MKKFLYLLPLLVVSCMQPVENVVDVPVDSALVDSVEVVEVDSLSLDTVKK